MKYFQREDTIVALSTPLGRGAIAVIRLSGQHGLSIINKIFNKPITHQDERQAKFGKIYSHVNKKTIDQVVVTYFKAPHSYTGEDVIEISCHCNPLIIDAIIQECTTLGARIAEPGEFTFRAFLNNKMDLSQAEALATLIQARSSESLNHSLRHLEGKLSQRIEDIHKEILNIIAKLEVGLEFDEEEVMIISPVQIKTQISAIANEIQQLIQTYEYGRFLEEGINLLIMGKPNVGKSSLFNELVGNERAIVSEIPGTTRDYLEAGIEIDGLWIKAIDTAGIRQASDTIEVIGIDRTFQKFTTSNIVLALFDASAPLEKEDFLLLDFLKRNSSPDKNYIFILNKIDLGITPSTENILKQTRLPLIKTSLLTGQGLQELKQTIAQQIKGPYWGEAEELVITSARHRNILSETAAILKQITEIPDDAFDEVVVAGDLRFALNKLGEITGETTTEEILNHIFSNFCVGK